MGSVERDDVKMESGIGGMIWKWKWKLRSVGRFGNGNGKWGGMEAEMGNEISGEIGK